MAKNKVVLGAPAAGAAIALDKVQDEVFSTGMMGQGFGLEPIGEKIVAPVAGEITMIAESKHAIGILTKEGLEVLIHMGIDTVGLHGEPFELKVKTGDKVQAGQEIANMALENIRLAGLQTTIMVIVTNSADKLEGLDVEELEATAGQTVATAYVKEAKQKAGKRNYDALADIIIENVGGKENINNLIHCITRLRFYLKDEKLANDDVLRETDGVIDVMHASGQYQVVIGNEVTNVFDAVMKKLPDLGEGEAVETTTQDDGKNPVSRAFSNLIGVITGSMSPVVGVIAAAGIIKGLLALLTLPQLGGLLNVKDTAYITVSAIADSAFYFLPVLVGFAAAKRLGGDPIVTAVIGGVLTYPQLVDWGREFKDMFTVGGFHFQFLNYTYSIFPMILAAWMAKKLGDWLKKTLPNYLQMIFNPLITVLVVSVITLVVTGPIIQGAANVIADIINWLLNASVWAVG